MKNKIKKFLKNDTVERVYKTFIQGFLGTLSGSYIIGLDMDGIKALIISAIMAGLSAVMNLIINKLNN